MTKNKSAVIAFFMAFSGVVMASDVPVQNHTELKPAVSRIFGWGDKEKAAKLQAIHPKLVVISESYERAEAIQGGLFDSGKKEYIELCTTMANAMKEIAPLIDVSFHAELEACVQGVEQAKFIAINEKTSKAHKILKKNNSQFIKLSRRFFR